MSALELAERPNEDLIDILGRPNFMCITIANVLRKGGYEIPTKSENEQAETLFFLLRHYTTDPDNWRANASAELRAMNAGHQP